MNKIGCLIMCALVGCTAMPPEGADPRVYAQEGFYKLGKPYQIKEKWYFPRVDTNYDEVGIASWYGKDFHGKRTANGEIYNMNSLSAAHKTLPLPVLVRVINLENGRSLVVRVNDRGPFAQNRIIDLSKRSAEILGFAKKRGGAGAGDVCGTSLCETKTPVFANISFLRFRPWAKNQKKVLLLTMCR